MQYFEVFKEAFAPSNLRLEGALKIHINYSTKN